MINKSILIGNLGKEPESRSVGESTVYSFPIAISENYKDKQGEWQQRTEWINITAWNAKICERLTKGAKVYIEGKIKTDQYEKNGVKTYSTKVVANVIRSLEKLESTNTANTPDPRKKVKDFDDDDLPF